MALFFFLLTFIPVILVHEMGHWLVGLLLGAKPKVFSIGFGKEIFKINLFKTDFKFSILPLGGYVEFTNFQFESERDPLKADFSKKLSPQKWIAINLAGPFANFLLTFVIFFSLVFSSLGSFKYYSYNDKILLDLKDNSSLFTESVVSSKIFKDNYLEYSSHKLKKVSKDEIAISDLKEFYPPFSLRVNESIYWSGAVLQIMVEKTIESLINILRPTKFDENKGAAVMGPIGIMKAAGESGERGLVDLLLLIASLSFAIGFFNLLPLSILDGGRAMLGAYELVSNRLINVKTMMLMHRISLSLIFSLFIFATLSDLKIFG